MKKIALLLALTVGLMGQVRAQTNTGRIEMVKGFGGYHISQHGQRLSLRQLGTAVQANEAAYKSVKTARGNNTVATVLSYAGGYMIGYPLGTALGGGKPEWALVGVGAGLVAVSIPFSVKSDKALRSAVEQHNAGLETSGVLPAKTEFCFGTTPDGVGLSLRF